MSMMVERLSIPDLDSFMRRVFAETSAAQVNARPMLRRDYETALNLLQRASDAFPVLMQQCQKLEGEVRQIRTQAQLDLNAANQVTEQWHQLALALKVKVDESDAEIAALRQRVEAAELQLLAGQQHADAVEQQASLAIGITTLFHDKIVEAFGVGSNAHTALDLIAKGGLDGVPPPAGKAAG